MPLAQIIAAQQQWARRTWPGHTGPRAPSLADNLIMPMSTVVHSAFKAGGGGELGNDEKRGKMQSLRSSSALAYNVFAPWHGQPDLSPLAAALGVTLSDTAIEFERKFPHGLNTEPPNLDVTLDGTQARPLAIECKFTEPYGGRGEPEADDKREAKPKSPPVANKYLLGGQKRWAEVGLPKAQDLAESAKSGTSFERLGVGQLLKHLLGLAHSTKQKPRLGYLWYDAGCDEAREHREELERFISAIGDEAEIIPLTYQELFAQLQRFDEPIPGYLAYLRERYFPNA